MPTRCLLYYITDRTQFPGNELSRRRRVLEKIAEAARCGVDYIQLREKDLPARELERLAIDALSVIREASSRSSEIRDAARDGSHHPSLLINSRTDVALAVGADGVPVRSDDVSPGVMRQVWCRYRRCLEHDLHRRAGKEGLAEFSIAEAYSGFGVSAECEGVFIVRWS